MKNFVAISLGLLLLTAIRCSSLMPDIPSNYTTIFMKGLLIRVPSSLVALFIRLPQLPEEFQLNAKLDCYYCILPVETFCVIIHGIEQQFVGFDCTCGFCSPLSQKEICKYMKINEDSKLLFDLVNLKRYNPIIEYLVLEPLADLCKGDCPVQQVREWTGKCLLLPYFSDDYRQKSALNYIIDNFRSTITSPAFQVGFIDLEKVVQAVTPAFASKRSKFLNIFACRCMLPVGITLDKRPLYLHLYYRDPHKLLRYLCRMPERDKLVRIRFSISHLLQLLIDLHRLKISVGPITLSNLAMNISRRYPIDHPNGIEIIVNIGILNGIRVCDDSDNKWDDLVNFSSVGDVLLQFSKAYDLPFDLENLKALSNLSLAKCNNNLNQLLKKTMQCIEKNQKKLK